MIEDGSLLATEAELAALQAEALGWLPLAGEAYLHVGDVDGDVVRVVGLADAGMAGMNVLLLA